MFWQLVSNLSAALDREVAGAHDIAAAVPAAAALKDAYEEMMTLLLSFTTTPGELGMIAAHEGANWPSVFGGKHAAAFRAAGTNMSMVLPRARYMGEARMFLPAVRTVISKAERSFALDATVLSSEVPSAVIVTVCVLSPVPPYGSLVCNGTSVSEHTMARLGNSQVYSLQRSPPPQDDFSYFVSAAVGGARIRSPSAPRDPRVQAANISVTVV